MFIFIEKLCVYLTYCIYFSPSQPYLTRCMNPADVTDSAPPHLRNFLCGGFDVHLQTIPHCRSHTIGESQKLKINNFIAFEIRIGNFRKKSLLFVLQ